MTNRIDRLRIALCTAFWFGYSPIIPGTIGTLPAVGLFVLISLCFTPYFQIILTGFFFVLCCILSVPLGTWAEKFWKKKDPRQFVLDEVASFFLTVLLFGVPSLIHTVLWAFTMTRLFDIIKPPPARKLESIPGGWGILLDDLVASMYAATALHVAKYFFPSLFGL
ncbi:MAG: phosphatidylglycerophosphatase A [Deltaproteobacteria bacterium]|nr:phosphatidylglycerophosphatase A [Deltaproteobacteria bacterium]